MPSVDRPGVKGVYVELPESLLTDARAFAADRGEKFNRVVAEALRRHMAYPPPKPEPQPEPAPVPLPGGAEEPTVAKKPATKKGKRS
ncbi:hypothetical protein [Gemmata sp.]|uniref:hypothetical protein n=1 Tax=Gemmata sp. TaxID=1914242 RepID=UPI003F6ECA07